MGAGRGLRQGAVALVATVATTACASSAETGDTTNGAPASVPIVTPTDVDRPYPYESPGQRATFESFLACAEAHGIEYEGPFTDSTGDAFYLRPAPDEDASRAEQEAVNERCPQMDVGVFATRVGRIRTGRFEDAADAFVRCLRTHGLPSYPAPPFDGGDVVAAFWQLPFDWSDAAFVDAARACVEPLRSYLFPPEAT